MNHAGSRIGGRARALIESVLRDGGSLEAEYPLVFLPGFSGRLVTLVEEEQVRAACAVLVRDLFAHGRRVRTGFIGSVVTHPSHRGRGLGTRLLQQAEHALAHDGCALALLWADEPGFYMARGWQPAGSEHAFLLEPGLEQRLPPPIGARAAAPDDSAAIHRLYLRHNERAERSLEETRALLGCPRMEVLVLHSDGDICAYACLGRGADFERTIHEWGGVPGGVLALIGEHLRRARLRNDDLPLALIVPPTAGVLSEALRRAGLQPSRGILGMAKLLDPEAAALLIADIAGPSARTGVEARVQGERTLLRVLIEGPAGKVELAPEELLGVLLPPRGERASVAGLESATGLALPELPLPLFAWGLDSI